MIEGLWDDGRGEEDVLGFLDGQVSGAADLLADLRLAEFQAPAAVPRPVPAIQPPVASPVQQQHKAKTRFKPMAPREYAADPEPHPLAGMRFY